MRKAINKKANRLLAVAVATTLVAGAGAAALPFSRQAASALTSDPNHYYYESEYNSAQAVRNAAIELNQQVVAEGSVLLKNQNGLPLKPKTEGGNINVSVFGKGSAAIAYFGFGSSDSLAIGGDWSRATKSFYDAFNGTSFKLNPVLKDFYNDNSKSGNGRLDGNKNGNGSDRFPDGNYHQAIDTFPAGMNTGETPVSRYTQEVKDSYANYNDAAIVVLTRVRGEGGDLAKTSLKSWGGEKLDGARDGSDHYLQLDKNEVDMLREAIDNFDNVIVLINASGPMEVGFLDDPAHYLYTDGGYTANEEQAVEKMNKIKAAMTIGFPGTDGVLAVPKLLSGELNPSGRLADTWVYDMKKDPTWQNQGYNGSNDGNKYGGSYVHYDEDIYLGYRYYETRYFEEGEDENDGEQWYSGQVQYPFGYGLSYTDFEKRVVSITSDGAGLEKDGKITVKVNVTNNGTVAGKEVVQVYYSTPYYAGGISKSHVELANFAKTDVLEAGASQEVEISFDVEDMKSYDWSDANGNGFKGYELEHGDYQIVVADGSHDAAAKAAKVIRGENDSFVKTFSLENDIRYATDSATGNEVKNLFDYVSGTGKTNDPATFCGVRQYMSRDDFAGTFPTPASAKKTGLLQESWGYDISEEFDKQNPWYSEEAPVQAAVPGTAEINEIKLWHLRGRDYDDPLWDAFLNQLTVNELVTQIENGFFGTRPINSVEKPSTYDDDGPLGKRHCPDVQWADNTTLAQTFNQQLAFDVGEMNGEAALWGINHPEGSNMMAAPGGNMGNAPEGRGGTYGLGLDTHRSPFGGRNFEYFSEDPILSGRMAANVSKGSLSKGCYQISKHIMLNDQESDRGALNTWASEQAIREIYGKPFEIAIKEGGLNALMAGVNRIGNKQCAFNWELLTGLIRNEWGFEGFVITDLIRYDVDMCIRAGCNTMMVHNQLNTPKIDAASLTPTQLTAIRESAKSVLYTCANTNGVQGFGGNSLAAINYGGVNTLYAVEGVDNALSVATATNTIIRDGGVSYATANDSVLPEGMSLSEDGCLSGAPSKAGEYEFTLNAEETLEEGSSVYYPYKAAKKTFKLKVFDKNNIPDEVIFEDDNIATIPVGFDYEQDIRSAVVFDGEGKLTSDVRYSLAEGSELPQGLKLENGVIKGVCVAPAGKYFFTVKAEAEGKTPKELDFIVSVKRYNLEYRPHELDPFTVGRSVLVDLGTAVSNGNSQITYKLKEGSSLPDGLVLDAFGKLSGTPVRGCTDYEFTVVASAELSNPVEVTYSITVLGLEMPDVVFDGVILGKKYKFELDAFANDLEEGQTVNVTYSLKKGSQLPQGFELTSDGVIVGKPVEIGKQSFTVVISAPGYDSVEAVVTIDIDDIYEGEITGGENAEPMPEKPVAETGGGCGSAIGYGAPLLAACGMVALFGAAAVVKKNKR